MSNYKTIEELIAAADGIEKTLSPQEQNDIERTARRPRRSTRFI